MPQESLPTNNNRPSCPDCGGKVISYGMRWKCKSCFRAFSKKYRSIPSREEKFIPSTEVIDLT